MSFQQRRSDPERMDPLSINLSQRELETLHADAFNAWFKPLVEQGMPQENVVKWAVILAAGSERQEQEQRRQHERARRVQVAVAFVAGLVIGLAIWWAAG